jgi:hypothetical protein
MYLTFEIPAAFQNVPDGWCATGPYLAALELKFFVGSCDESLALW